MVYFHRLLFVYTLLIAGTGYAKSRKQSLPIFPFKKDIPENSNCLTRPYCIAEPAIWLSSCRFLVSPFLAIESDGSSECRNTTIIEDPNHIIGYYRAHIRKRIDDAYVELRNFDEKKHGMTRDMMKDVIKDLQMILDDIKILDSSTIVFSAIFDSSLTTEGRTDIDVMKEIILLKFPLDILDEMGGRKIHNLQLIGHELRHGVQYHIGQLSILRTKSLFRSGALHDITDETDAIRIAGLAVSNRFNPQVTRICDSTSRELIDAVGSLMYRYLPAGPIGIHSRPGRKLVKETRIRGTNKLPNTEYYSGWELDYNNKKRKK